jgi:hypothetical protein
MPEFEPSEEVLLGSGPIPSSERRSGGAGCNRRRTEPLRRCGLSRAFREIDIVEKPTDPAHLTERVRII